MRRRNPRLPELPGLVTDQKSQNKRLPGLVTDQKSQNKRATSVYYSKCIFLPFNSGIFDII